MFRLLSDENFNGDVIRGLLARVSEVDLVRVQDVGLMGMGDPDVLAWAAKEGRLLLTHDRKTVPGFAYSRVAAGEPMPGVLVLPTLLPIGQAVAALEIVLGCSEPDEYRDRVVSLPQ